MAADTDPVSLEGKDRCTGWEQLLNPWECPSLSPMVETRKNRIGKNMPNLFFFFRAIYFQVFYMSYMFFGLACIALRIQPLFSATRSPNVLSVPGPMTAQWSPLNDTSSSVVVKMQLSFKYSGSRSVWGAIGITGRSLSLSDNWRVVALWVQNGQCSIGFANAVNSQLIYVQQMDPWSVGPRCISNPSSGEHVLAFDIGGTSAIPVPNGPTYLMFSSSFIPKFHYALVDLLSGDAQFVTGDPEKPDPWLITHGAVFILDFSVLMPIASFVILWDRERFYSLHNALGVVILVLLVVGWASLTNANKHKEAGNIYLPFDDSAIARSHSLTGIIARFVAVGVCFLGVILAVVRMPKTVRPIVRWSHAIVGVALSFYGPFVVWNGWVRMGATYGTILDTSPFVWLLVVVALCISFPIGLLIRQRKKSNQLNNEADEDPQDNLPPVLALPDVFSLVKDKHYFLFNDTQVVVLDQQFVHPAGNDVMTPYIGKDITRIFSGTELFDDNGRRRTWVHSAAALAKLTEMIVCTLDMPRERSLSTTVPQSSAWPTSTSLDEGDKTVGIIVSMEHVSRNRRSPTLRFEIKIIDPLAFNLMTIGTKMKISTHYTGSAIERVYTIAQIEPTDRVVVFYIKIYHDGVLTPKLAQLAVYETVYMSGCIAPVATDPNMPLLLLAAGTGIVPMLSYMMSESTTTTTVLWWLRHPTDLFLIEEIKGIEGIRLRLFFTTTEDISKDPLVEHLLSSPNITLSHGRICGDILAEFTNDCMVVMSGPPGFISAGSVAIEQAGLGGNFLSLD